MGSNSVSRADTLSNDCAQADFGEYGKCPVFNMLCLKQMRRILLSFVEPSGFSGGGLSNRPSSACSPRGPASSISTTSVETSSLPALIWLSWHKLSAGTATRAVALAQVIAECVAGGNFQSGGKLGHRGLAEIAYKGDRGSVRQAGAAGAPSEGSI
jgi:hypothetical protein